MESTQANNYEPLEGRGMNNRHEPMDSPDTDGRAPTDQKHAVYLALLAAGIGFVLPYNSFIIAADYWKVRFPERTVALDMSMTYISVAFTTVLLNNVFLTLAPFRVRVLFGFLISFTTLSYVAFCEVGWHAFADSFAYSTNLVAVGLVAVGCTVQQSSFYGFASMLPKQYTQAVMAGESIAGFLVSSNRVVTKLLIKNDDVSTMIFFFTSTFYVVFSYMLYLATRNSPFVRYHMKACAVIVLRPDESRLNEVDVDSTSAKYGVLSVESTSPSASKINNGNTALSFSNPVYELSNPTAGESVIDGLNNLPDIPSTPQEPATPTTVAFKVEHVLTPSACTPSKWSDVRNGFLLRWRVAHAIYPYMVCIALAYAVTLSLYPGIESEIVSCTLGTWMPVLLMFAFNASDVIGKILAAVPYAWSRRQLILMSGLRVVLVPLLLLCCAPRHQPVVSGDTAAFVFTIALGLSNGLAGSLPMMLAPAKVPGTLKEVTGNMMTLSYNVGLTVGSLIGYIFEAMLGYPTYPPCPTLPYVDHMTTSTTTSTTTTTPASTTMNSTALAAALFTTTMTTLFPTTEAASVFPATTPTTMLAATTTQSTTVLATTIANIMSTVASIPDILSAAMTTVATAVTSIGDISAEIGGSTTDPQTPMDLMKQI
ncbi:equilibrative nucleoside transporter 4 [Teleopsis dalmanni]|uniref:equilibrative nucleoside transporter 4 n=1 Tax=Teleopsis dalmanni TaxID=139649 RepID=UPI0018CD415A|nr:equilibrative nucleoside transporter 4 [Teleopsis dalmanni]